MVIMWKQEQQKSTDFSDSVPKQIPIILIVHTGDMTHKRRLIN